MGWPLGDVGGWMVGGIHVVANYKYEFVGRNIISWQHIINNTGTFTSSFCCYSCFSGRDYATLCPVAVDLLPIYTLDSFFIQRFTRVCWPWVGTVCIARATTGGCWLAKCDMFVPMSLSNNWLGIQREDQRSRSGIKPIKWLCFCVLLAS